MLLNERAVMQNTSLLFEMPQEPYSRLDATFDEYKCMCLVYDLYVRQKDARDVWSKTLWSELNPQLLLEGMEGFLKQFKQLPKACRTGPVAAALEADMKKFKNSVPLFIELKNDAMKDIHWQKLMDQTGELWLIFSQKHTYPEWWRVCSTCVYLKENKSNRQKQKSIVCKFMVYQLFTVVPFLNVFF